jgi:hypothetical protein
MKVKRSPLIFHNVLGTKARCNINDWHLVAADFRNAIIKNGLYSTGPIIYQISNLDQEKNEADYTLYIPVNMPLKMPENDRYQFFEEWKFEDGLVFRHADLDDELAVTYDFLHEVADANEVQLQEPFYNIYLDVYGEGIIDVYAPITKEGIG